MPDNNGHEKYTILMPFLLPYILKTTQKALGGLRAEENIMNEGLRSHFLNLYNMVMADGEVSLKEKTELYRIGEEFYNVKPEEFDRLVLSDEILFYIPQTDEEKILYLYDLALIAWADGTVVAEERQLLERFALRFGILPNMVKPLVDLLIDKAKDQLSHEEVMKEFSE